MTIDLESAKRKASAMDTDGDKEITLAEVLEANKNGKNRISYSDFEKIKNDPEKFRELASSIYKDAGYKIDDNLFDELHSLAVNNKLPHKSKAESQPKKISI